MSRAIPQLPQYAFMTWCSAKAQGQPYQYYDSRVSLLQVKRNISRIRLNVTEDLWNLFQKTPVFIEDEWTGKVRDRLKVFEQDLLRSMKSDGWDGTEDESAIQWSFAGALFYSIIVITTIGKTSSQNSFEGVKGASCMISRI
jgi:hypothetical protein